MQKYVLGWFKADEMAAADHLFRGGTNSNGTVVEAALRIELTLTPMTPSDDNGAGRDPVLNKVLLAAVDLRIDVPGDLTYVVGQAPPQNVRLFLVRGDAAVGLSPDQPADSLHWYLWNWRDESPPLKASTPSQNESSTWGRLKGLYR